MRYFSGRGVDRAIYPPKLLVNSSDNEYNSTKTLSVQRTQQRKNI